MSEIPAQRLTFIDVTRTYAILLALLAHALNSIGFLNQLGSDELLIKQYTRMATPLFVFIFGFMLEFVYVRKAQRFGLGTIYGMQASPLIKMEEACHGLIVFLFIFYVVEPLLLPLQQGLTNDALNCPGR